MDLSVDTQKLKMKGSVFENIELSKFDIVKGSVRLFGWIFVCFSTKRWGVDDPQILFLYAMAVLMEVLGLIIDEVQNDHAKCGSILRNIFIAGELVMAVGLLIISMVGQFLDSFTIIIWGRYFVQIYDPLMIINFPLVLYLSMYFAPLFFSVCWVIRGVIVYRLNKKRVVVSIH